MVELHCHLDGSLSLDDIKYLAKLNNVKFSPSKTKIHVSKTNKSLHDFLRCFDFPLKLLQTKESISYATYSLFRRLFKEGVNYAEVRFGPSLCIKKGLSQYEVVKAAIKGYKKAIKEFPILGNLILCMMRHHSYESNLETIKVAKKYLNKGVCAIDLAGDEANFSTESFKPLFQKAKSLKVPYIIHAGEADGPLSVLSALNFNGKRIGHGIHVFKDEKVVSLLKKKHALLEVCPTSELETKCISSLDEIPIKRMLKEDIPFSIGADNTCVCNTFIKKEIELLKSFFHLTKKDIKIITKNSIDFSFATPSQKKILYKREKVI
mgnify:CR=1 FL=1